MFVYFFVWIRSIAECSIWIFPTCCYCTSLSTANDFMISALVLVFGGEFLSVAGTIFLCFYWWFVWITVELCISEVGWIFKEVFSELVYGKFGAREAPILPELEILSKCLEPDLFPLFAFEASFEVTKDYFCARDPTELCDGPTLNCWMLLPCYESPTWDCYVFKVC